jgi:hypothetical protein
MLKRRNLKQGGEQKCSSFSINNTATFKTRMNNYYTYAYLREDGTPFYIGKGRGNRLFEKERHNVKVPPNDRIIFLKQNLNEKEAFKHERYMIFILGRKDIKTGILRNKTDGGEGASGYIHTDEAKLKISKANKGENNPFYGREHTKETKQKMKGRKPPSISLEARKRMSEKKRGIPRDRSIVDKMMETRKINQSFVGKNNPNSKVFVFTSPQGQEYIVVGQFQKFCKEQNISCWGMKNMIKTGKMVPGCKNWKVRAND